MVYVNASLLRFASLASLEVVPGFSYCVAREQFPGFNEHRDCAEHVVIFERLVENRFVEEALSSRLQVTENSSVEGLPCPCLAWRYECESDIVLSRPLAYIPLPVGCVDIPQDVYNSLTSKVPQPRQISDHHFAIRPT